MSKAVIVGRPINGIHINGLEWLVDEKGYVLIFRSVENAKEFLRSKMVSDEEMEELTFLDGIGTCFRCGSPLFPSQIEGYTSQCFTCDEDFYSIEQNGVKAVKDELEEALGVDRKILFGEGEEKECADG